MAIVLFSDASGAAVALGIICAWRSLYVPAAAVGTYELIAGILLFLGLTGLGLGLAAIN